MLLSTRQITLVYLKMTTAFFRGSGSPFTMIKRRDTPAYSSLCEKSQIPKVDLALNLLRSFHCSIAEFIDTVFEPEKCILLKLMMYVIVNIYFVAHQLSSLD